MGGTIVQQIAYQHPQRVLSVTISNSFCKISTIFLLYSKAREKFMELNIPKQTIIESILPWVFSSGYLAQDNRIEELTQLFSSNPFPITEIGYRNQLQALASFDSTSWIHKIAVPCLFIAGEEDIIAFADTVKTMAKQVVDSTFFCIPKVGHVPHIENPKLFNQIVYQFIASR